MKIFPSDLKPIELLTVIKPSLVTDHELKRGVGRREERGERREEGGDRRDERGEGREGRERWREDRERI